LPGEGIIPILVRGSDMKRKVSLLVIAAGVFFLWFIGMTEDGQAMGRELIIWLRAVGGMK
jgi:hypothetical protein